MGFLILDTDKQSTSSLRLQLSAIGDGPVREVPDASAYAKLRARRLPPPDVIFFDQDGDPERVESFKQEIENVDHGSSNSFGPAVILIGTDRASRLARAHDTYLRKPVFFRKLEKAIVEGYARGQRRRSGVGYLGEAVFASLVRELPHSSRFWKQLLCVQSGATDAGLLSGLGVLFIFGSSIGREDLELVRRLHRFTSASRILLVGVGNRPEETRDLRTLADYFVPSEPDWKEVLRNLASRRLSRLASDLALSRARSLLALGKEADCEQELRHVITADPWNLVALGRLADLAFFKGQYQSAEEVYRRILDINPCQPRPYLRLLAIEMKTTGEQSVETLSRARSYCPKVPAIQSMGLGPR